MKGYIEAVHPGDKNGGLAGMDSPEADHGSPAGTEVISVTILPNTKLIRASDPVSLKELKPAEHVHALAQPAPDGRLLTVSLSAGKPRGYPVATAVPGKRGWVYSPYAPSAGPIDVSGYPPGTEVRCLHTKKIFFTPF